MVSSADPVALSQGNDVREQLSSLRGMLMLSMLMIQQGEEDQIVHLATTAIPALARARCEGVLLQGNWHEQSTPLSPKVREIVEAQLPGPGAVASLVQIPGRAWSWAFSLTARGGGVGWLIVSAERVPTDAERSLLRTLAQQIGVSLVNARLLASERIRGAELAADNRVLESTMEIHDRLTRAALRNPGQAGIANAVFELTGLDVAVEDAYGNLRAWAGGTPPHPYPRASAEDREKLLETAGKAGAPIRDRDRLLVVASPDEDILGVLALNDPNNTAGEVGAMVLEYAGTVLATELARLRNLADNDVRLRRDLIDELLAGADEEAAMDHAQALGYDLGRPHRVVVIRGEAGTTNDVLFNAVRKVARGIGNGSLLAVRSDEVILISDHDQPWEKLRLEVMAGLGGLNCRVGVGSRCTRFADFARSSREAHLALRMQEDANGDDRVTLFEDLGVYQLLADVPNLDHYVDRWLGDLIEHDAAKKTRLVETLTVYLERGGSYDSTATGLFVHRSTLKGRLGRIRAVSGHDLANPETRFNLELATRALKARQVFRRTTPPS